MSNFESDWYLGFTVYVAGAAIVIRHWWTLTLWKTDCHIV